MKRLVVLALLSASFLAGCGSSPVSPLTAKSSRGTISAAWSEDASRAQLLHARKVAIQANTLRLFLSYRYAVEGVGPVTRTLVIDCETTADRSVFRSGYRPVQIVLDSQHVLQDDETLLMLAREHEALAYHVTGKEQAGIVSLAGQMLYELIH